MNKYDFTVSDIRSERLELPFYFLSDNHLSTKKGIDQNKRIQDMLVLLEEIRQSRGTLFILGDFFDFWFDKKDYVPPELKPIINALKAITHEGIEIHYLGGNHDYWVEGFLTREVGVRFYPDALQFEINGKKIWCEHGDNTVYSSKQYPLIRQLIRNPLAIGLLKLLPVNWTYKLGEFVSQYNKDIIDPPPVAKLYINQMRAYLLEKLNEGYDLAISGHIHFAYTEQVEERTLAMLGDWINQLPYGYMDRSGFKLIEMK